MAILQTYDFEYNPNLEDPQAIYPNLKGSLFTMSLQTQDEFFTAQVGYNRVTKRLFIEIYDSSGALVKNRIGCVSEQNLCYIEGYYLYWHPTKNLFEFGSVE